MPVGDPDDDVPKLPQSAIAPPQLKIFTQMSNVGIFSLESPLSPCCT